MNGRILGFSPGTGFGVISGDDGNRYCFTEAEWRDSMTPTRGVEVDFVVEGDNAASIYRALRNAGSPGRIVTLSEEQNRTVAGILTVLVGWVGVHKFYLGLRGPAKIQAAAGVSAIMFAIILPHLVHLYQTVFTLTGGFDSTQPYIRCWAVLFGVKTAGYLLWSAMGIIGLIEGIMYLTKSDGEFAETYLNQKKPWF